MASWDVFHADRLELERGLGDHAIRAALARGDLRDDDLVRPSGTTAPWARLADIPELLAQPDPAAAQPPAPRDPDTNPLPDFEELQPGFESEFAPPAPVPRHDLTEFPESSSSDVTFPVLEEPVTAPPQDQRPSPPASGWAWNDDDDNADDDNAGEPDIEILADESDLDDLDPGGRTSRGPTGAPTHIIAGSPYPAVEPPPDDPDHHYRDLGDDDLDLVQAESHTSRVALPVVRSRDRDVAEPADGDDDGEAVFSLSRSATQRIEELDLAPMVDVAFQLVLFFMVTATTVLYKTLEIPKPSGESPAGAVAQGRSRSLDDLKDDFILVEIDERGAMKLDREPIEPVRENLVELLRRAREKTSRKTMLLSADFATLHRNAVLAYDAANEIGLGIAIAKPTPPQGPAPTLRGAPPNPAPARAEAQAPPAAARKPVPAPF